MSGQAPEPEDMKRTVARMLWAPHRRAGRHARRGPAPAPAPGATAAAGGFLSPELRAATEFHAGAAEDGGTAGADAPESRAEAAAGGGAAGADAPEPAAAEAAAGGGGVVEG